MQNIWSRFDSPYLICLLAVPMTALAQSAYNYTIIAPPDATYTTAACVNDINQVVGTYQVGFTSHGFSWTNGNYLTIDVPGATGGTDARGCNNLGAIAGSYTDAALTHGFVLRHNEFETVDYDVSSYNVTFLLGINNNGQIVGQAQNNITPYVNFIYDVDTQLFTTLSLPTTNYVIPYSINDYGVIAGTICSLPDMTCVHNGVPGSYSGFLYEHGALTIINYPNALETDVAGVNNLGQAVGVGKSMFVYLNGTFTGVPSPPASINPAALSINNSGAVLGIASFAGVVKAFVAAPVQSSGFVTTLATAGEIEAFAPESIVTAYGSNLSQGSVTATELPLPTSLGGTALTLIDSTGVSRIAPLFYVSPTQVNYEIPAGTTPGTASATITDGKGASQVGFLQVGAVSPGLFALNASGLVAAWVLPVVSGVQESLQLVYQTAGANAVIPLPLNVSAADTQLYLEMYGTGIRNAKEVTVAIGGLPVPVLFAGAAPGFAGEDQVNVGPLPAALAGKGNVPILLRADGLAANTVNVSIE